MYKIGDTVRLRDRETGVEFDAEVEQDQGVIRVHWYGAKNSFGGTHYCAEFDAVTLENRHKGSRLEIAQKPESPK